MWNGRWALCCALKRLFSSVSVCALDLFNCFALVYVMCSALVVPRIFFHKKLSLAFILRYMHRCALAELVVFSFNFTALLIRIWFFPNATLLPYIRNDCVWSLRWLFIITNSFVHCPDDETPVHVRNIWMLLRARMFLCFLCLLLSPCC